MKGYKKRPNIQIRKPGTPKNYIPKVNRKKSLEIAGRNDAMDEFYGNAINPIRAPQWCNVRNG